MENDKPSVSEVSIRDAEVSVTATINLEHICLELKHIFKVRKLLPFFYLQAVILQSPTFQQ